MKFNLSLKNKTFFPFLKYNLYKFIKQKSTYISTIIYISLNLMALIAVKVYNMNDILDLNIIKIIYFILYLFYSSSVIGFVGVKANYVLKDEINDGTILIFSTLGQSRRQIIFQKWLAYQIIIISYILSLIFLTSIIYILGFVSSSEVIIYILSKTWQLILILILIELLVSSFALILSYWLSPKALTSFLLIFSFINFFSYYVEAIFIYPFSSGIYQETSNILLASKLYSSAYSKNKIARDIYFEELDDTVNNFDHRSEPFLHGDIGNLKNIESKIKTYQKNFKQYFATLIAIDKWSKNIPEKITIERYINEGFAFLKNQSADTGNLEYQNLEDKKDFLLKQFSILNEIFKLFNSENGFFKDILKVIDLNETINLVKNNNYGHFFAFVTGNLTYRIAKTAVLKYDNYSKIKNINSIRLAISFFNMPKQWFSIYQSVNNDNGWDFFGLNFDMGTPMRLKFINSNGLYITDFDAIQEFFPIWMIIIYHSILMTITLYFYFRIYNRKNLI